MHLPFSLSRPCLVSRAAVAFVFHYRYIFGSRLSMASSDPMPIPLPSMDTDLTLNTEYLPEYDTDLSLASPSYSAHPGLTEISLHPEPFSPEISSSTHHWSCETKHMRIDLGPHIWGLTSPSYGLGGTVVGSVKFLEQRQHVEQVTVSVSFSVHFFDGSSFNLPSSKVV